MVFCHQNCSDLLWEKIVLVIEKTFWNSIEIIRTICSNSERSEQFLVTECFSNFSCMFLNPNIFFSIWILIVLIYNTWETSRNKLKKHSFTLKIVPTFHCLNKLFQWSQKVFSITRTIFAHSRSEQFW